MSRFFDAIKALLPRSRAFELFINNMKYKFFEALSVLPVNVRREAELVYFDLFPDTTRFPKIWENIFTLNFTSYEIIKRRDILDITWKLFDGNQSAVFLEGILQRINSEIKIIENNPVGSPRESNVVVTSVNGNKYMVCGNKKSVNGYIVGDVDYEPSILQNDISGVYSIPSDKRYWEMCFYVCKSVTRNTVTHEILYVNI